MLHELATKHNTCKQKMSFHGKSYLDIYEEYMSPYKNTNINLFEIGVLSGQSLRMWKEYFPYGNIFAIDIDPDCLQYQEDRIFIENCSQDDVKTINSFIGENVFDFIIDDGSHLVDLTIDSFNILFPKLKSGGFYIIEDTECFYYEVLFAKTEWPGMHYNKNDELFKNNRDKFNSFLFELIKNIDFKKGEIRSIKFYHQQIFIEKA